MTHRKPICVMAVALIAASFSSQVFGAQRSLCGPGTLAHLTKEDAQIARAEIQKALTTGKDGRRAVEQSENPSLRDRHTDEDVYEGRHALPCHRFFNISWRRARCQHVEYVQHQRRLEDRPRAINKDGA